MAADSNEQFVASTAPLTFQNFLEKMRHPSASELVKSVKVRVWFLRSCVVGTQRKKKLFPRAPHPMQLYGARDWLALSHPSIAHLLPHRTRTHTRALVPPRSPPTPAIPTPRAPRRRLSYHPSATATTAQSQTPRLTVDGCKTSFAPPRLRSEGTRRGGARARRSSKPRARGSRST